MSHPISALKALFHEAVALPPDARERLLARITEDSASLARELRDLLEADAATGAADWLEAGLGNAAEELLASAALHEATLGRYRVLSLLGSGGMGAVYLAERADGEYTQEVAIKVLRRAFANEPERARFRKERQILATLEHPNIARLLDGGTSENGEPYLVMERIVGQRLGEYAASVGLRARIELVLAVCAALGYAHRRLVIHRDLKPSNILVTADGTPKLLDFGIATLARDRFTPEGDLPRQSSSETGPGMFTERYASPEQRRGQAITTATDVYSLGIVLCELCAGDVPSESSLRLLPTDLACIVRRAVAEQPEQRYPTIDALAADLEAYLAQRPVVARDGGLFYRTGKLLLRRWPVAIALLLLLGVASAGFFSTLRAREEARAVQHLAQRVEHVGQRLRLSRMLAPHDVREDERRAVTESRALERDARHAGNLPRRSALLARGRIALLLGRDDEARQVLDEAFELGQPSPELSLALGLAHAQSYRKAAERAERPKDEAERLALRTRAWQSHGERAAMLLSASQDRDTTRYAAAVLALLRGAFAEARLAATDALRISPWLYEAWVVHGDAYAAEAALARRERTSARALSLLEQAGESYARGLALSPSAPDVAWAACAAREQALSLHMNGQSAPGLEQVYQAGKSACEHVLTLDPGHVEAVVSLAHLDGMWAVQLRDTGGAAGPQFDAAIAHATRATELAPREPEPLRALARILNDRAESERRVGKDPSASLSLAVGALARAQSLAPDDPVTRLLLGVSHAIRGQYAGEHLETGRDPTPDLEQALVHLAWVVAQGRRDPLSVRARNEQALALCSRAMFAQDRGEDPRPFLQEGLEALAQATTIDPAYAKAWNNRAALAWVGATYEHAAQRDPEYWVALGVESNERALSLRPGYAMALYGLARFRLLRARYLLEREGPLDPATDARARQELALAQAALAESQAIRPWASTLLIQGIAHRTLAADAMKRGTDPRPHLDAAEQSLAAARALEPTHQSVLERSADVLMLRAAHERDALPLLRRADAFANAMPETRGGLRRRGLVALAFARAVPAREAGPWFARARLQLGQAAAMPGPLTLDVEVARVELELEEGALRRSAGEDDAPFLAAAQQALAVLERHFPGTPAALRCRAQLTRRTAQGKVRPP